MEAPLFSATSAEIVYPGHHLTVATANTAWPAGQQLTKKCCQRTTHSNFQKGQTFLHSNKGVVPFLITKTQTESVQVLAQLLVWRGPVTVLWSARTKEVENYCPQRCCPIIRFTWFEKRAGFQVPFLCTGTFRPVGSFCSFQDFTWFSDYPTSWTIWFSRFHFCTLKKKNGPSIFLQ